MVVDPKELFQVRFSIYVYIFSSVTTYLRCCKGELFFPRTPEPTALRLIGTVLCFSPLTVVLSENQCHCVTSANHTKAKHRLTNYTPAVHTGWGPLRGRWRHLNRAVLTGMACCPFSNNSRKMCHWVNYVCLIPLLLKKTKQKTLHCG